MKLIKVSQRKIDLPNYFYLTEKLENYYSLALLCYYVNYKIILKDPSINTSATFFIKSSYKKEKYIENFSKIAYSYLKQFKKRLKKKKEKLFLYKIENSQKSFFIITNFKEKELKYLLKLNNNLNFFEIYRENVKIGEKEIFEKEKIDLTNDIINLYFNFSLEEERFLMKIKDLFKEEEMENLFLEEMEVNYELYFKKLSKKITETFVSFLKEKEKYYSLKLDIYYKKRKTAKANLFSTAKNFKENEKELKRIREETTNLAYMIKQNIENVKFSSSEIIKSFFIEKSIEKIEEKLKL